VSRLKFFPVLSGVVALTAVAFLGVGAGVAQAAAPTPAARVQPAGHVTPLAGVFTPLRNLGNSTNPQQLCLEPVSTSVSAQVVQEPCDGSVAEGWQTVSLGGNNFRFISQLSGLCIFAFSPPASNNDPIGMDTCRDVSNEVFNAGTSALPNVVPLQSEEGSTNTGFCLDVPGASPAPGLQMQLFQCNGTVAQRWVIGFA
jgi:hypothetical protein